MKYVVLLAIAATIVVAGFIAYLKKRQSDATIEEEEDPIAADVKEYMQKNTRTKMVEEKAKHLENVARGQHEMMESS